MIAYVTEAGVIRGIKEEWIHAKTRRRKDVVPATQPPSFSTRRFPLRRNEAMAPRSRQFIHFSEVNIHGFAGEGNMTDLRLFLLISTRHLSRPINTTLGAFSADDRASRCRSWCSWTTYGRLMRDAGYWTGELPLETELGELAVDDGGTWGQQFIYDDLAHIIIPRMFTEEPWPTDKFRQWEHEQDVDGLSILLTAAGIADHVSDYVLEVKSF